MRTITWPPEHWRWNRAIIYFLKSTFKKKIYLKRKWKKTNAFWMQFPSAILSIIRFLIKKDTLTHNSCTWYSTFRKYEIELETYYMPLPALHIPNPFLSRHSHKHTLTFNLLLDLMYLNLWIYIPSSVCNCNLFIKWILNIFSTRLTWLIFFDFAVWRPRTNDLAMMRCLNPEIWFHPDRPASSVARIDSYIGQRFHSRWIMKQFRFQWIYPSAMHLPLFTVSLYLLCLENCCLTSSCF